MSKRIKIFLATLMLAAFLIAAPALAQETPPPTAPPAPTAAPPKPAAPPAAPMVESLKIICDGKVKTDGLVNFVFTPAGGEAKEIRVTLQKKMNRGEVCRDIAKELSVAIGGLPYAVDNYDSDKIKIKGKDAAKFSVTLGAVTATGVTLELK